MIANIATGADWADGQSQKWQDLVQDGIEDIQTQQANRQRQHQQHDYEPGDHGLPPRPLQ